MKNTLKLLTIALACTIATQSFGMWNRFVDRAKFLVNRSVEQFKFDIRHPKALVKKTCAGVGAGVLTLAVPYQLSTQSNNKTIKKMVSAYPYTLASGLGCISLGTSALAGGPLGLSGWLTAAMLANRASEKNMTSARQDFASRFFVKLEPFSKPLPKMADIGTRPPTIN